MTTVRREDGGEEKEMKEGEGISQRTYMHDPWTRTTVWGLSEGAEAGWRGAKGEKLGQL